MPYLNLDLDYFDHPKVRRLYGLLGKGSEVLPVRLWCYCGKYHADDGRLTGYSAGEVEAIAGWWGEKGAMVDAMLKVGFLERDGETLTCHDWTEHEGHLGAFKARAKTAAKAKWDKLRAVAYATSNASSIAKGESKQCPNLTSLTDPYQPTKPADPMGASFDPGFVRFWNAYPNKVGRNAALSEWSKILPAPELVEKMVHAIEAQKRVPPWSRGMVHAPANWLAGGHWADEIQDQSDDSEGKRIAQELRAREQ